MHSTSIHAVRPEPVVENVNSFYLERHDLNSIIFAVTNNTHRIELGQMVAASGNTARPQKGCKGIVVEICQPHAVGRTSDIIRVHFEGFHHAHWVKFKDLSF